MNERSIAPAQDRSLADPLIGTGLRPLRARALEGVTAGPVPAATSVLDRAVGLECLGETLATVHRAAHRLAPVGLELVVRRSSTRHALDPTPPAFGVSRAAPVADLGVELAGELRFGRYVCRAIVVRLGGALERIALPGPPEPRRIPGVASGICCGCGKRRAHRIHLVLDDGSATAFEFGMECVRGAFGQRIAGACDAVEALAELSAVLVARSDPGTWAVDESLEPAQALMLSAMIERVAGRFVGVREARERGTISAREQLRRYLHEGTVEVRTVRRSVRPIEADRHRAGEVLDWIRTLSCSDPNTYHAGLAEIQRRGGRIVPAELALWIAAPATHARRRGSAVQDAPVACPDTPGVDEVPGHRGEAVVLECRVLAVAPALNGNGHWVCASDAAGHRVLWPDLVARPVVPEEHVSVRAVILRHRLSHGAWQTILDRVDLSTARRAAPAPPAVAKRPGPGPAIGAAAPRA